MNKLYMVRDIVGGQVIKPIIIVKHEAAAVRIFTDAMKDERTDLFQHPADYELLYLGEQNDDTGEIAGLERPRAILTGRQYTLATATPTADAVDASGAADARPLVRGSER